MSRNPWTDKKITVDLHKPKRKLCDEYTNQELSIMKLKHTRLYQQKVLGEMEKIP